jgi:hypothetical protein
VIQDSEIKSPRLYLKVDTQFGSEFAYEQNGFYQSYFQIQDNSITGNSGVSYWQNFVCSLRYTFNSALKMTSTDYF